jgi:RES domain-containing protein
MPFRLADIKKTVRSRGDGERYVHPKLLDAAVEGQVDLALAYFHARLGRKRRDFEPELLVRFFGEPKVARGLVACLSATYRWRAQTFADVLDARDLARLVLRGIHGPSDLRLHLFDLVNQEADGFLAGERDTALLPLAHRLGLSAPKLEQLFTLDAEENAVLVRVGEVPETALVVAHYNFQTVHALIRNCDYLDFPAISAAACRALAEACHAYGLSITEQDGAARVHNRADSFGNFARWGQRVARALYAAASVAPSLLTSGRACLHVGGKAAWYLFDRRTLSALTGATGIVRCALPQPEFVERWQRQRPAGGAGGWQLISMAEPLVSTAGLVVPPHAMRRDECQVLLWPVATPADGAAARALHDAGLPVLALRLPGDTIALPAEIAAMDCEARGAAVVAALQAHWSGGRADAGAQALEGLLADLEARGFIPEAQVSEALGCGSLDEVPDRLQALDPARGTFLPGIGLCSPTFAQAMRRGLRRKPRPKSAA